MRVTILAIGSRGDVQPYAALGLGLQSAGHEVRIAAYPVFKDFLRSYGLRCFPISGNPRVFMGSDLVDSGRNPFLFWKRLFREMAPLSRQHLVDCLASCQDAEAILVSPLGFIGFDLGEMLKIPCYGAYLAPSTPTGAYAHPLFPALPRWFPARGVYNRMTYRAGEELFWHFIRNAVLNWQKEFPGVQTPSRFSPYPRHRKMRQPVFYGFSPSVLPQARDWGEENHVTGFWFLNSLPGWKPSDPLREFLESGPPPVYIGFGSVSGGDPDATTNLVLGALTEAGQRGILLAGWGGLGHVKLPPQVFLLESIPHDWLFPRTSLVIHHGGAGTTAASFRAGVPTLVVPSFGDQFFWGTRVHELGLGPAPIPRKKLTARRLASAIGAVVQSEPMRRRAKELGERIRSEDGVARGVEAFHRAVEAYRGHR